ncbi:MAG TPA: hypothetical protein VGA78_15210 [Gemmatimonadales bacterium]
MPAPLPSSDLLRCCLIAALAWAGQDVSAQTATGLVSGVTVESNLPAAGFISRHQAIDLRLSGAIDPAARLAVLLGATDLTDLFRSTPGGLRYTPTVVPLSPGEREMTVYLVRADGRWEELGRFPLRVRNAAGLDRWRAMPRLDLGLEGQLAQSQAPAEPAPPRTTWQDFTGQLALETDAGRGPSRWTTQASVIGVSHQAGALRFAERADAAPQVDLSSYLVRLGSGPAEVAIGHVSLGNQRHLISGFTSRGAAVRLTPGSRVELAAGLVNGSSIVGWTNPVGLNDSDHRLLSGTLALEALTRPGGLRLELSGLSGSVRPQAGYNQGVVNDAESSRGVGLRVTASDPTQRIRLETGFARSSFDNPDDSSLARGGTLVPVEEVTRNAHYVDAAVDVLRAVRLGPERSASLALGFRRERVDPLYRSLGAFARADQETNQWEARATIAGLALQASHARSTDNLSHLASVLTSRTRRNLLAAELPLASLLGTTRTWLPLLSYGFDRTQQLGEGVPENGGFSESHVPDQVSRNQTFTSTWNLRHLTFGYRLAHSLQDNRQPGREASDFANLIHGATVGLTPLRSVSVDLSLDLERAENRETSAIDRTRRFGGRASVTPGSQSTLAFSLSHTRAEDDAGLRRRLDTILDTQWSSTVPGLRRFGSRYYFRFSRTTGRVLDQAVGLDQSTERWSISSGFNLGLSPVTP